MNNAAAVALHDWRHAVSQDDVAPGEDEAAFATSLLGATAAAFRLVRSLGLTPADASDAIQEASIRAWRHRADCRGDFRAWFLTIAYREARRPGRQWLTLPRFWSARSEKNAPRAFSPELRACLHTLPQRQRVALSLRYEADLTTAGIAAVLGISEAAAKQLLARARDSLRRSLSAAVDEAAS